ncbi:MAG: methylated-DNA--[protein]-cysteine S-methyltransferase [Bacilli bacterium]|jgi:methylated-DNA-[protein]-cysteine S-methyltransferase|nr:methylated-DNA--[protein]-cysteine S-methyltransferase [Bacilli bacterium]MDD3348365.1 methylated-DNA--[protein]-cysteine S-methyltransferase [Bacilli bacterium]
MVNGFIYQSIIGPLAIYEEDGSIIAIKKNEPIPVDVNQIKTALIEQTILELDEYFTGKRTQFSVSMKHHHQGFHAKVWTELSKIPYGVTVSYKELAIRIGHPRAYRAVGGACHANPIPILIPCHRVVATNGSMTGFGWGLDTKKSLLALEKKFYK